MKQKNNLILLLFLISSGILFMGCTKKTETVFQTESNTGGSTESNIESNTESNIESNTESNTESSTESNTDSSTEMATPADEAVENSSTGAEEETTIYVHICGAVMMPGVYGMPEGSRVCEAVKAAGGFAKTAARDFLNQAILLQDGQKIVILSEEEVRLLSQNQIKEYLEESAGLGQDATDIAESSLSSGVYPAEITGENISAENVQTSALNKVENDGLVNINTATADELTSITGIGASRAEAIIAFREENGLFTSIEDIMKVTGIKEGLFQKLKNQIKVQ